jgi:hypothetical protein
VEQGWIGFALAHSLRLQIYGIVFLSHPLVQLPDSSDGWYEDPGLHGSIFWECPLQEPGCVYVGDHVHHGSHPLLFGYIPMVYHLEHGLLYRQVVLPWFVGLDALEGHLYQVAEEDLWEVVGNPRHAGQV